jgi:DNA-binding NarL/FixJ family response regulator
MGACVDCSEAKHTATARMVDDWRLRYNLTPTETAVLFEAARGGSRAMIASRLRLASETVKSHARNLIMKTGDDSLRDAGVRLMRELVDKFEADSPR